MSDKRKIKTFRLMQDNEYKDLLAKKGLLELTPKNVEEFRNKTKLDTLLGQPTPKDEDEGELRRQKINRLLLELQALRRERKMTTVPTSSAPILPPVDDQRLNISTPSLEWYSGFDDYGDDRQPPSSPPPTPPSVGTSNISFDAPIVASTPKDKSHPPSGDIYNLLDDVKRRLNYASLSLSAMNKTIKLERNLGRGSRGAAATTSKLFRTSVKTKKLDGSGQASQSARKLTEAEKLLRARSPKQYARFREIRNIPQGATRSKMLGKKK